MSRLVHTSMVLDHVDRKIAKEIMGWGDDWPLCVHGDHMYSVTGECEKFRPSSNIYHSNLVLETMRDNGFGYSIFSHDGNKNPDEPVYRVSFYSGDYVYCSYGESLPLAICEAAINVIDHRYEEIDDDE